MIGSSAGDDPGRAEEQFVDGADSEPDSGRLTVIAFLGGIPGLLRLDSSWSKRPRSEPTGQEEWLLQSVVLE
jgi:hypothetical protein